MTKRLFDFSVSLILTVVLSPLLACLYLFILVALGKPVLFSQVRTGRFNKPFRIYKFRTMSFECDSNGLLLPDHLRLTKLGSFLRKSSLDELPELFNVLKGDMSLVGPRPLHHHYLQHYSPLQLKRHCVKPGITGLAQVKGRNLLSWEHKFKYDLFYVKNNNLCFDLYILFLTISTVLGARGVYSSHDLTVPEFSGARLRPRND